jgi:hypothetical protein
MKRLFLVIAVALGFVLSSQAGHADPLTAFHNGPTGAMHGVILSNDGRPVNLNAGTRGMIISIDRRGGRHYTAQSDPGVGGEYRVDNLRPGVYDITVPQGLIDNIYYAPQHIFGIVIYRGVDSVLNITMTPGANFQDTGTPPPTTQPAADAGNVIDTDQATIAILKQQVADMAAQIQALKDQIAALKQREAAATAAPAPTH